jgi:hypothetical protein
MSMPTKDAKSLFRAVVATILALFAFASLRAAGATVLLSLFGGMTLAGVLNIAAMAALNGDLSLPTSGEC